MEGSMRAMSMWVLATSPSLCAMIAGTKLMGGWPAGSSASLAWCAPSLPFLLQVRVTSEAHFGRVAGGGSSFAMDNTACNGTETKLVDCGHVSPDDCGAGEVAGVVCDRR